MKTKLFGLITVIMLIMCLMAGCDILLGDNNPGSGSNDSSLAYSWYGNGSANSFTINNATQLREFARIVNGTTGDRGPAQSNFNGKTVTLSADINLSSQAWIPIGSPYQIPGIIPFSGTFDGNGKTISGLYTTFAANRGLFGFISEGGIVKNIFLTDISVSGQELTGGIAGVNRGTVHNCHVTGNVNGSAVIGGVVGSNRGIVSNSSFSGSVTGNGGIVGDNLGIVQNCFANGSVHGLGGVVGSNSGTVRNCYALNNVYGYDWAGGIVGINYSGGIVQNCYAIGRVSVSYSWITASVGGVVSINHGMVQNCVALNSSINSANDRNISRVANEGYLSNNYARNEMTVPSSISVTSNANGNHGADVLASDYNSQIWWTTTSNWNSASMWDFTTVWQWDNTVNLPRLRM
jgi:hypothetical protein